MNREATNISRFSCKSNPQGVYSIWIFNLSMPLEKNIAIFGTLGALGASLAVILGAFAAHGLKAKVPPETLAVFETGARYQMYHSLALLLLTAISSKILPLWLNTSGAFFAAGIILFSGSLYLIVFTHAKFWGAVTPIGGLAFILGWITLAAGFIRSI